MTGSLVRGETDGASSLARRETDMTGSLVRGEIDGLVLWSVGKLVGMVL